MIERISQSFMKDMKSYLAGEECGVIIKKKYVDGVLVEVQSDSMAEGSYFEFLLSVALPKNGKIPQPVYMVSALKKKKPSELTVDDMTVDYRRAHVNAARVKKILGDLGLKIISAGKRIVKGRFEGTIDLIVECQVENPKFGWKVGDRLVIDVKYSGLVYDRWEKFGWQWSNIQKEYHGVQAKQYHFLTGLPFYFLVVSNTNKEEENDAGQKVFGPTDVKLFRVLMDEHMIESHVAEGNSLMERLMFESEIGLTPRPEYVKCQRCPLYEECGERYTVPFPVDVDLTII